MRHDQLGPIFWDDFMQKNIVFNNLSSLTFFKEFGGTTREKALADSGSKPPTDLLMAYGTMTSCFLEQF